MTESRYPGATQGETMGEDQEPREVGRADPAVRDPRPDGPMEQPVDSEALPRTDDGEPEDPVAQNR